jgi:hypothetical protein
MRVPPSLRTFLLFTATFVPLSLTAQSPVDSALQQIRFHEVDTLFANPGEGWMVDPFQKPRFPDSIVYLRLDWYLLEPEDGKFNWKIIDDVIAQARRRNATIAMRIMTANAHSSGYYSSPKWLFDEGCKGFEYKPDGADAALGTPMPRLEPDYADKIYLTKHAAFLKAFGERYNGNPSFEFLDIGSYGIWGEWHTPHPASIKVRKKIVDMYLQDFDKTPLVYMSDDADVMSYALAHGAGLRRDGVGDPWHEARWVGTAPYQKVHAMGDAWKQAPIVFEWYLDYNYMHGRGWSIESAVNFMLKDHVSVVHDNIGPVPQEVMPLLNKLARLAGYRFVLRGVSMPKDIDAGDDLTLNMLWANVGVAKLYHPYTLNFELRNSADEVVMTSASDADPREWLPGKRTVQTRLAIPPDLEPGEYTLDVALIDPARQHPPLHLAIDAPEKDGWYTLAKITIN